MKFGSWLLSLLQPAVAKILFSLGVSAVTFVGFEAVFSQVKGRLMAGFGGLPADMMQLFLLSGGGIGVSMIVGAILTKITIYQLQNNAKFLLKAGQ